MTPVQSQGTHLDTITTSGQNSNRELKAVKIREPRGNPCEQRKKMKNSTQTVTEAQDQTGNPEAIHTLATFILSCNINIFNELFIFIVS